MIPDLDYALAGPSFEDLDVALAEVDADGRLFHINDRGERAWGWQTGQHVPPVLLDALGAVTDGGTQALPALAEGGPLFGVSVPGRGWLLLGHEAEAPEAEAVSIFKSLIEKVPALVVRLHADGTVRYAGHAAASVLGYTPEALVGKPLWLDVVHPEDRWKLTEALRRAAETHRVVGLGVRFLTADEALRHARFYLIPADDPAEIEGLIFHVTTPAVAEPGLMQSEALYRTFLEQSPLGILHLDVSGLVTFENHRFRQIVGEAVEDAWIGRRLSEIDGLEAALPPLVDEMLRAGRAIEGQAAAYRHGGMLRHLIVHGSPIRQPGGAIVGAVMMIEDVTEQRLREHELHLRERYEQAEAALRDAVLADLDETIFLHEAAAVLGRTSRADRLHVLIHAGDEGLCVSQAAWVRRQVDDSFTLSIRSAEFAPLRTAVVQRQSLFLRTATAEGEARALLEQTEAQEALWVPFFDAGRLGGFILLERLTPPEEAPAWPETEQRLIDHLVRLFETLWSWIQVGRRYRLTVATIDDCLFTFRYDDQGQRHYLFITPQIETLTGYGADAVLARAGSPFRWIEKLIHPDDRAAVHEHDEALRNGRESRITYRVQHRRGADRWVCEHATPHRDAAGSITISGILVDVTEQKDAEEILLSARAQVETASRLRSTFVSTMSHELRTPLGAIHGFADLLAQELADYEAQTGASLPPQVREFADAVCDNARRVLQLADDLFAWTNAGHGVLRLEQRAVPLHALVERCAGRIRAPLADKKLTLTLALAKDEPVALGDAHRIEQILDNLLSNAVKFTDAGGVTVRTRTTATHALIEIEDTGIGLDPEDTERLFTPFMQADSRLNRRFEGTGIGLALVKRLLDLMDGTLDVSGEKGRGSTFCVALPLAASSQGPAT